MDGDVKIRLLDQSVVHYGNSQASSGITPANPGLQTREVVHQGRNWTTCCDTAGTFLTGLIFAGCLVAGTAIYWNCDNLNPPCDKTVYSIGKALFFTTWTVITIAGGIFITDSCFPCLCEKLCRRRNR